MQVKLPAEFSHNALLSHGLFADKHSSSSVNEARQFILLVIGLIMEGAKDFFPKRFCATLPYKLSPAKIMKTVFWCELHAKEKILVCFSANVGRHFLKSNNVGRQLFKDFAQIFRDFARVLNKSKLLGVRSHPLHPLLPHTPLLLVTTSSRLSHALELHKNFDISLSTSRCVPTSALG